MLHDPNDPNPPRTIGEVYAGAVSQGSTRVGNDHRLRTSGDIIGAAGMSPFRMGMALMRLTSEWQSGATPPEAAAPEVKVLAQQIAARRVEEDIDPARHKVSEKRAIRAGAKVQKSDIDLAYAEQRLLAARATDWHVQENKLRFQRMKTLPAVRAALLDWVQARGWVESAEDWRSGRPHQLVADTIRYYLSPVCPHCHGRKRKVINGRAIGSVCEKCDGTGERRLDHGGRGRALLSHMKSCAAQAAGDLREGAHRLRRSDASTEHRENVRTREKIDGLRRADEEATADEKQDRQAVAEVFRESMAKPETVDRRHNRDKETKR